MHTAHLAGNTSGVSKSSSDWLNSTGFPGDVCVAFFNILPGNKNAVAPNPLTKEESRRVYNCVAEHLPGSRNTGFSKVCEKCKVRGIIIHPRVLHTGLFLWRHFHAPDHDVAQNET